MSLKRPKRGETEEDLLRQQKDFLATNKVQKLDESVDKGSDCEKSEKKIADNHDLPQIVTEIVEREVHTLDQLNRCRQRSESKHFGTGFPKAFRRDDNLVPKKGKSLFAQQMSAKCGQSCDDMEDNCGSDAKSSSQSLVTGKGLGTNDWKTDIDRIRSENQLLINKMSETEIREMRRDLMSKLCPKTVDFLLNKTMAKSNDKPIVENMSNDIEMSEPNVESMDEKDLPIKQMEVIDNKWLNMDVVEKDKMSWMGDIAEDKGDNSSHLQTPSEQTISARFDFEANLISKSDDIDVHSGLYHHRTDESKAGYTIEELYTLIQSTFSSQKVLGLQVLSKVLTKSFNGLFDECFNENLIQQLMQNSALVLVTRRALDDNTETVWRAAINALHSMLCNTCADELFLDRGFTLFSQRLEAEGNVDYLKPCFDSTKLDELSDEQLMKMDVIHCLLKRTSLLQRIRYLLEFNKNQLDSKSVNDLLDILIRIARHSFDSMQDIVKCPYLLETIVKNFIPVSVVTTNDIFNKANPKAMKLIRLLVNSDLQTTNQILNTFPQIIDSLKVYLTLNPENCANSREILELSIESLRVWFQLLSQRVCVEDFWQMFPIVIKQLQYCSKLDPIGHENSFDFQYASTLISVVKALVQQNPNQDFHAFNDIVLMIAMKWLTLIKNTVIVPNFDANLCLLSSVEYLLMTKFNTKSVEEIVFQIIESKTFLNKLINNFTENSNLVKLKSETQPNRRDSSNLPSFGSIGYKTLETVSYLNKESSICLLIAILQVMKTSTNDEMTNKLHSLMDYMKRVTNIMKYDLKFNSFDLFELNLLSEICLIYSSASVTSLTTEDIKHCLNVSLLMIPFIKKNTIKQNLLNRLIFNKSFHSFGITECIEGLSLKEEFNFSEINFEEILCCFRKHSNFDSCHWVFDPLIKAVKTKDISSHEVYHCLTFVSLVMKTNCNYFKQMITSSSALFCLISSVFLISDVFLDNSVQNVMNFLLKRLLSEGIVCQIEERVPYFETTGDFFVRFLSDFESHSYGNKLFINYLLVFLQSKCSQLFKHKLFVEFSTALRLIRIDFKEILTSIDCFLFPIERDGQTLEIYLKSLLCGALTPNVCPFLYLLAVHHLNHSLFRSPKDNITENKTFDRLLRSVHNSSNDSLKQHLINYSLFDPNLLNGSDLKANNLY